MAQRPAQNKYTVTSKMIAQQNLWSNSNRENHLMGSKLP